MLKKDVGGYAEKETSSPEANSIIRVPKTQEAKTPLKPNRIYWEEEGKPYVHPATCTLIQIQV